MAQIPAARRNAGRPTSSPARAAPTMVPPSTETRGTDLRMAAQPAVAPAQTSLAELEAAVQHDEDTPIKLSAWRRVRGAGPCVELWSTPSATGFTALNPYDPVVVPEVLKLANRHLLCHLRQALRHLPRQPRRHRHALPPLCTTSYLQSVGPIDGLKFQIRGGVGDGSAVAAFDNNRQLCTACWPVTRNAPRSTP